MGILRQIRWQFEMFGIFYYSSYPKYKKSEYLDSKL